MAITNASRLADFGSGISTVLQVDKVNQRVGIGTTNPQGTLQVGTGVTIDGNSGIVSATSFYGDLTGNATASTYASTSGIATYSETAGIATYASTAGIATYASTAGVATSLLGGNVSGNLSIIDGNLVIGTSGQGIDFSATTNSSGTMTSELLDDYEEGTFTPVVTTGWTSPTYSDQIGTYTKIGNVVNANIILIISGGTATASNPATIGGLPFTTSGSSASSIVSVSNATNTASNQFIRGLISGGTTTINLYHQTTTALIGVSGSNLGSANLVIRVSATYYTAS